MNIVRLWEIGATLSAYSMASSYVWKLLSESDEAPAVLCSESVLKNTPHPVVIL